MSQSISVAHVQQYKGNIIALSQQMGSRLRSTVRTDGEIIGKKVFFDRLAATAAQKKTTRHGDTPLMNQTHSRRSMSLYDYEWADLVDKQDVIKMITDPTSKYVVNGTNAMARSQDDEIISALGGTAYEGETGDTAVALPSAQKIAHGSAGLTTAKLRTAKKMLDEAEVDERIPRFVVCSAEQIEDLLSDSNLISSDYNTVKALVEGKIDTWLGFKFIRSERLSTDATPSRLVYAYAQTAIGLGVPMDIEVDVSKRADKSNSMQVYLCQSIGAVRIEDAQVVEIACNE